MKEKWINSPIFIVGHPKSGTSLLNSLLDSHHQLLVLPEESDFYDLIWNSASLLNIKWRMNESTKKKFLLKSIIEYSHFKNYFKGKVENDISGNLNYEDIDSKKFKKEIKEGIKKVSLKDRQGLFKALIKAYSNTIDKKDKIKIKYWVEKTPNHLWYINEIKKDFLKAKIIFVYRDPRDNYLSYKKKWPKSLTPIKFSKNWNESIDAVERIPKKYLLKIKYEDLILNPKNQISKIKDFLDLESNSNLFEPTKNGKSWQGNSMFGKKSKNIDSTNIGRFKTKLPINELEIIETLCQKKMLYYNYTIESDFECLKNTKKKIYNEYQMYKPRRPNNESIRQILGRYRRKLLG